MEEVLRDLLKYRSMDELKDMYDEMSGGCPNYMNGECESCDICEALEFLFGDD